MDVDSLTDNGRAFEITEAANPTEANITVEPHGDHILVQLDEPEKERNGILIPELHRDKKAQRGTVLSVGIRRTADGVVIPYEIKPGDRVLVNPYAGKEFQSNQWLYPSGDIIAIFRRKTIRSAGILSAAEVAARAKAQ